MKNLIITGAAGHLGGTIIRRAVKLGYSIRGLLLPGEKGPCASEVKYFTGDITDASTLEGIFEGLDPAETAVIHTAGLISIQEKVSPAVRKVNVGGTLNIIEKCRRRGIARLVYVSSVEALPTDSDKTDIRETPDFDPDRVAGAYPKTKAIATKAVLEAGKSGLDVVVVLPSGILGPYDEGRNHLVQLLKMYIARKLPALVNGGYDFVDVRDVADGVLEALEKGRSGECYILSNRYHSMGEIGEYMRKALGRTRKLLCLPLRFVRSLVPLLEFFAKIARKRPIFTKFSLKTLDFKGRFRHDKATAELGYRPRDMRETVRDTILWLKRDKLLHSCK